MRYYRYMGFTSFYEIVKRKQLTFVWCVENFCNENNIKFLGKSKIYEFE